MTRPSHTTVVAYLALFIALGAGTAFAAGQLAKNSVGSKQLKKNAVTGAKVKKDAITSAKVKDGSLLGADLADGTITGAKIADGSLSATDISGGVRASNVIGVAMTKDCGRRLRSRPAYSTTTGPSVAPCILGPAFWIARRRRLPDFAPPTRCSWRRGALRFSEIRRVQTISRWSCSFRPNRREWPSDLTLVC